MENKAFKIHYLGDNPPTEDDIREALSLGRIDDEGTVEIREAKPDYEICDVCEGTGNNEITSTHSVDCYNCGGSGWVK